MDDAEVLTSMVANTTLIEPDALSDYGATDLSRLFQKLTWVGGRVTLTDRYLHFAANGLNRAVNPRVRLRGRYSEHAHLNEYMMRVEEIEQIHVHRWLWFPFLEIRFRAMIMGVRATRTTALYEQLTALR